MPLTTLDFDARQLSWSPFEQIAKDIPEDVIRWVQLPGSLTLALQARTQQFNVQVLEQTWVSSDAAMAGFEAEAQPIELFSRKVLLCNATQPWVAAHTLIPKSSLENGLSALTQLENKPLGELLFASKSVHKDNLQACKSGIGWGRRSRYFLHQQPLVVSEFFLSDLLHYEQNRT